MFLKITDTPPAFANLGDETALDLATRAGVAIFQVPAAAATPETSGAYAGWDLAYTPGPSADFAPCNYRGPYGSAAQAARDALAELDAAEGVAPTLVAADDLRPGDAIDLQNMPYVRDESFPGAPYELETVYSVERETADCVRVDFNGSPSVGWPPALKFWTRRALVEGARVRHGEREGYVQGFRSFTEDGEPYTFATVVFDNGEREGVDVDELDAVMPAADTLKPHTGADTLIEATRAAYVAETDPAVIAAARLSRPALIAAAGEALALAEPITADTEPTDVVLGVLTALLGAAAAESTCDALFDALEAAGWSIGPNGAQAAPEGYGPDLQAVDALRAASGADGLSAAILLEAGVVQARRVVAAWATGDLAGAVNGLEEWAVDVESNFPALDYSDDDDAEGDAHAFEVVKLETGGERVTAIYYSAAAGADAAYKAAESDADTIRAAGGNAHVREVGADDAEGDD